MAFRITSWNPADCPPRLGRAFTCTELVQYLTLDGSSVFDRLLNTVSARPATDHAGVGRRQAFEDWLSLTIENQVADLEYFLQRQGSQQQRLVIDWLDVGGYSELPPLGTRGAERDLFLSDMNIVALLLEGNV